MTGNSVEGEGSTAIRRDSKWCSAETEQVVQRRDSKWCRPSWGA
jgi:hypothetical protein